MEGAGDTLLVDKFVVKCFIVGNKGIHFFFSMKHVVTFVQGIGKSTFVHTMTDEVYRHDPQQFVGIDFKMKNVTVSPRVGVKLQIWDYIYGGPFNHYHYNMRAVCRGARVALLAFDLSNRETLQYITSWLKDFEKLQLVQRPFFVVIGLKKDKKREITEEEGRAFAKQLDCAYFEFSSKQHVEELVQFSNKLAKFGLNGSKASQRIKVLVAVWLVGCC